MDLTSLKISAVCAAYVGVKRCDRIMVWEDYYTPENNSALPFDLYFQASQFVLDTPAAVGSHQTAGSVPAPRESHPRQVLCRLSPLPATALRRNRYIRSDCGWTGVSLALLPVIAVPGAAR